MTEQKQLTGQRTPNIYSLSSWKWLQMSSRYSSQNISFSIYNQRLDHNVCFLSDAVHVTWKYKFVQDREKTVSKRLDFPNMHIQLHICFLFLTSSLSRHLLIWVGAVRLYIWLQIIWISTVEACSSTIPIFLACLFTPFPCYTPKIILPALNRSTRLYPTWNAWVFRLMCRMKATITGAPCWVFTPFIWTRKFQAHASPFGCGRRRWRRRLCNSAPRNKLHPLWRRRFPRGEVYSLHGPTVHL